MVDKKAEVRVFLDGIDLKIIDDLVGIHGNTRSEVVRTILHNWVGQNFDNIDRWRRLHKEAAKEGYVK